MLHILATLSVCKAASARCCSYCGAWSLAPWISRLSNLVGAHAGFTKNGTPKLAKPSSQIATFRMYSVLEPLDGFKNSEIKVGIRLDDQVPRPELFNLYKKFRMAFRCAKQVDIFSVPFFVQPAWGSAAAF